MKKTLITITLSLIVFSNLIFARERINNNANAHVKPTYSTEIESVEIIPTVIHMSETEEVIMETAPTTTTKETTESKESAIAESETQAVIPDVDYGYVDDKVYTKDDVPIVGYSRKDTDEPTKAKVELVQELMGIMTLKPFSFGVKITYDSDINGWAEFDVTYKTNRGAFTNTIIKPIHKGTNILTLSSHQSESVTYISSQNVYCSEIRRTIIED